MCSVDNCTRVGKIVRTYCLMHYQRMKLKGSANATSVRDKRPAIVEGSVAKIPLGIGAKDGYAIVDKKDAHLDKYNWHLHDPYVAAWVDGDVVKLHHMVVGKPPLNKVIDHINRNPKDNRRENLRTVTQHINSLNASKSKRNRSGYKGVHWVSNCSKWRATIRIKGDAIKLGLFTDISDAVKARRVAEIKYIDGVG